LLAVSCFSCFVLAIHPPFPVHPFAVLRTSAKKESAPTPHRNCSPDTMSVMPGIYIFSTSYEPRGDGPNKIRKASPHFPVYSFHFISNTLSLRMQSVIIRGPASGHFPYSSITYACAQLPAP
jgi:hypothetical protein